MPQHPDFGLFVSHSSIWSGFPPPASFASGIPGLLPLFRSLEVAFQASRFPSDGLSSINDVGTRIGLWVSAFETLFHRGGGHSVNKHVVQKALSRFEFYQPRLRRRFYTYKYDHKTHNTNFAGLIYDELYRARNDFTHGNPVTDRHVRLRKSLRYPPLWVLAPMPYNVALRAFTKSMFALSQREQLDDLLYGKTQLSNALMKIRTARKEYD